MINNSGLLQIDFLRMTSDSIRTLLKADEAEVKAMQQELALIREGSLCISKRGEGFQFSRYDRNTQKRNSIMSARDEVNELARRMYLENRIKAIEDNARRLSAVLENADGARLNHS